MKAFHKIIACARRFIQVSGPFLLLLNIRDEVFFKRTNIERELSKIFQRTHESEFFMLLHEIDRCSVDMYFFFAAFPGKFLITNYEMLEPVFP